MKVLYPGSFDPITNGHVDVIKRIAKLFDEVIVAVLNNQSKEEFIPLEDRLRLVKEAIENIKNVSVESFSGLTVKYAKSRNANVIVRGLRAPSDFEYELEMSQINYFLSNGLETLFIMTNPKYSFIRSSRVKELVNLGGEVKELVPNVVFKYLYQKMPLKK
ncbi:MAG: pantetheine-phosphate adenylyltransferase [Candidatus Melainabacteria bacterium RIFCSPLOWO2_02_FULL_35_15]|nr:MAG: pantetheine-phosphate adenylyltransferase [Candidatus Melainabacteria bacterium RIFCSPLOWO2_12_FULL_35_11]OGI13755.1 MAG: pantetheine-phosphate adenylyltransferase [Candidatus Melainabacteria bacterium RIFCSPLOWO2_02_FULL_35_15]